MFPSSGRALFTALWLVLQRAVGHLPSQLSLRVCCQKARIAHRPGSRVSCLSHCPFAELLLRLRRDCYACCGRHHLPEALGTVCITVRQLCRWWRHNTCEHGPYRLACRQAVAARPPHCREACVWWQRALPSGWGCSRACLQLAPRLAHTRAFKASSTALHAVVTLASTHTAMPTYLQGGCVDAVCCRRGCMSRSADAGKRRPHQCLQACSALTAGWLALKGCWGVECARPCEADVWHWICWCCLGGATLSHTATTNAHPSLLIAYYAACSAIFIPTTCGHVSSISRQGVVVRWARHLLGRRDRANLCVGAWYQSAIRRWCRCNPVNEDTAMALAWRL